MITSFGVGTICKGNGCRYIRGTPGGKHFVITGSFVCSSVYCPLFEDLDSLYSCSPSGVRFGGTRPKLLPFGLRFQTPVKSWGSCGGPAIVVSALAPR